MNTIADDISLPDLLEMAAKTYIEMEEAVEWWAQEGSLARRGD